jgi:ankyrin repeat protein
MNIKYKINLFFLLLLSFSTLVSDMVFAFNPAYGPNTTDENGLNLHDVCLHGDCNTFKRLLDENANPNSTNNEGLTLLHLAAQKGLLDKTKLLIEASADVDFRADFKGAPTHVALSNRNYEILRLLVENKADVNSLMSHTNSSLLGLACKQGNFEVLEYLLNKNADVNIESISGTTPLLCAIEHNQNQVFIERLLAAKANPNVVSKNRYRTELPFNVGTVLVKLPMTPLSMVGEAQERYHRRPLHMAAFKGNVETICSLLKFDAEINATLESDTALVAAIKSRQPKAAKLLIENNATLTDFGTILLTAKQGYYDLLAMNFKDPQLFDINQKDYAQETLLHQACRKEEIKLVKLLLDHQADPSLLNSEGKTPRDASTSEIIKNMLPDMSKIIDRHFFSHSYFVNIPGKILDPKLKMDSIQATIRFADASKEQIIISHKQTQKNLSFTGTADINPEKIFFKKNKKGALYYDKEKIFNESKKGKKPVVGVCSYLSDFEVTQENGQLYLSVKASINGGAQNQHYKWLLSRTPVVEVPASSKIANIKTPPVPKNDPVTSKVEPEKLFPTVEQIAGVYSGELRGKNFLVRIPRFGDDNFNITFIVSKNDGQSEERSLLVRAHSTVGKQTFFQFEPLSKINEQYKLAKKGTTFDAGIYKQKSGNLGFLSAMQIAEMTSDAPLQLAVETSLGQLLLKRTGDELPAFAHQALENNFLLQEDDGPPQLDWNFNERNFRHLGAEGAQDLHDAPVQASNRRRKKAKVKKNDSYFEIPQTSKDIQILGRLGYSETDERRSEKLRMEVQSKMEKIAQDPVTEPSTQILRPHKAYVQKQPRPDVFADSPRPQRLNPETQFTQNPMYGDETIESNLYFGLAYVKGSTGATERDSSRDIVIGLKNFNKGYEQFAVSASWCSLMVREWGAENFQLGKNIHCSYHQNGDAHYLNLSHFGLFMVHPIDGGFELYQMPESGSSIRVAYILRPWNYVQNNWNWAKKITDPLEAARYFSKCPTDYEKLVDEAELLTDFRQKSEQIRDNLITDKPLHVRYKGLDLLARFDRVGGELIEGYSSRPIQGFSVSMVNKNEAILSILFMNDEDRLEAITTNLFYE